MVKGIKVFGLKIMNYQKDEFLLENQVKIAISFSFVIQKVF